MEVSAAGTGQAAKQEAQQGAEEAKRRVLLKQGPLFKVEGSGGDDAMDAENRIDVRRRGTRNRSKEHRRWRQTTVALYPDDQSSSRPLHPFHTPGLA